MRTFFRYWSWGMIGAVCLAVGLSLFVRYSVEKERPVEEAMFQTEKKPWVSFVLELTQKWKIKQIDQKQDILLIVMNEEKDRNWEAVAKDVISESFVKRQNLKSIRLRMINEEHATSRLICIERSAWIELVNRSEWMKQSLQEFNLSNDKKTTD